MQKITVIESWYFRDCSLNISSLIHKTVRLRASSTIEQWFSDVVSATAILQRVKHTLHRLILIMFTPLRAKSQPHILLTRLCVCSNYNNNKERGDRHHYA